MLRFVQQKKQIWSILQFSTKSDKLINQDLQKRLSKDQINEIKRLNKMDENQFDLEFNKFYKDAIDDQK